jgi:hypothetical protein
MIGANGFILPDRMMAIPGMTALGHLFGLPVAELENFGLAEVLWIIGLLAVVWGLPNAQQWLRNYRTSLVAQQRPSRMQAAFPLLVWRPASIIGFAVGWLGFFLVIRAISAAPTEFLYFQF